MLSSRRCKFLFALIRTECRCEKSFLCSMSSESSEAEKGAEDSADKRRRTSFTNDQRGMLEVFFRSNPYPDSYDRKRLAKELDVKESSVMWWFGHRRAKEVRLKRAASKSSASQHMVPSSGKFCLSPRVQIFPHQCWKALAEFLDHISPMHLIQVVSNIHLCIMPTYLVPFHHRDRFLAFRLFWA